MKRIVVFLVSLLICLSLAACGFEFLEMVDGDTEQPQVSSESSDKEKNDISDEIDSTSANNKKISENEKTNTKEKSKTKTNTKGKTKDKTKTKTKPKDSFFEIYFLDVDQGDAAVIICDKKAMLIDGGNNKKSSLIYSFLKAHNIKHLEYIIASHPDADHIGGLSGALNYATVSKAFCTTKEYDTKTFLSFKKYLKQQDIKITIPKPGDKYSLGSATFTVIAPQPGIAVSDNTSLVIRIVYGNTSFLFTGDAETSDESELLDSGYKVKSTVLKVAHHGSKSSTSSKFINTVKPKYAVISVGGGNTYGHPTAKVLNHLADANVKTYRTDMNGDIHCTSDGSKVSFDTEKKASHDVFSVVGGYSDWKAAKKAASENGNTSKKQKSSTAKSSEHATYTYVANTNTGKFHYQGCVSVNQMKDKNKAFIKGTRDDLISMGYSPCGNCHP